jgi:hypothetical protein
MLDLLQDVDFEAPAIVTTHAAKRRDGIESAGNAQFRGTLRECVKYVRSLPHNDVTLEIAIDLEDCSQSFSIEDILETLARHPRL